MLEAHFKKYILNFKRPSGTSRGIMNEKETWFLILKNKDKIGIGECGLLKGLSIDDKPDYEEKLQWVCDNIHFGCDALWQKMIEYPSIQFGIEMAFRSFESENPFILFPSDFTNSTKFISINGLVWMGDEQFMKTQIEEKLAQNFTCIKLKIGAIDFKKELDLLAFIRQNFDENRIEIRVDANGAFYSNEALYKLTQLSGYKIHSIEQPIQKNNTDTMADLCKNTPIPIALDEELIGVFDYAEKETLLQKIMPQYIILKPSLVGGFQGTKQWITIAEKYNIGWWITSALESNVGLNAIAQFTFTLQNKLPQGLGTGSLYANNFDSPLVVENGFLKYDKELDWRFNI